MSLLLPKLQSLSTPNEILDSLEVVLSKQALDLESAELFLFALESQLKKDWFEPRLLLALVKLVQFFPEEDLDYHKILQGCLIKALSELPNPCLKLLLLMIPEKFQEVDIVKKVSKLLELLESSHYEAFWVALHSMPQDFKDTLPDISAKMQEIVFAKLKIVFATINSQIFFTFMGVEDMTEVAVSIKKRITVEGELVKFPQDSQTEPRPREAEKLSHLKFKNMKGLLNHLNR